MISRATEAHRPGSTGIELRPTDEIVRIMVDDTRDVADALRSSIETVARLIDEVAARMNDGGRLIYIGAGTSGRLAQLDAAECIPTFGIPDGTVMAILAGGVEAAARPEEGAEDDLDAAARRLTELDLQPTDSVIGVSASGTTPFVLEAMRFANACGALTACVTNNLGSELASRVDLAVEAVVGSEIVAGSTRLKAGTAQKVILNTLSTIVMMKLGRTYNGYMVDVRSTNRKLVERAKDITAEVTGLAPEAALKLLHDSQNDVKIAILSHLLAIDPPNARDRLDGASGNIRTVLDTARKDA